MRYNQPYGAVADAAYVNGNPATAVRGSVPPAEAMEFPQREIVHVIEAADIVPSNDDLYQLLEAIRFISQVGYVAWTDTGTANAIVANLDPVPTAYKFGMKVLFRKKPSTPNSGPCTVNFNGLGEVSIRDNTAADFGSGALVGGGVYLAMYDGSGFRVLGGAATYTSVTSLTANSGDMVEVLAGSGIVNFRTNRGTHNATPGDNDRWPRGKAVGDDALYMLTSELLAWLADVLPFPEVATPAEVRAGTDNAKYVSPYALANSANAGALTYAATTNWDMAAAGYNAKLALTGNTILAQPTNMVEGLTYSLQIQQDATGGRTITWPSCFKWGAAGTPSLSTAANAVDLVTLICRTAGGSPVFLASINKGY